MKKLIVYILVFVCLLTGCVSANLEHSNDKIQPALTSAQRKQIWQDYSIYKNHDFTDGKDTDSRYVCGMRYYGTHSDYVVLLEETPMQMMCQETVGNETFFHGTPFYLYAYRNGQFLLLKDVYNAGSINDADLAAIAEIHETFE